MNIEDLLGEAEQEPNEPIDITTEEGFKKYIMGNRDLPPENIRRRIYHTHDTDKIRRFTEIYVDVLITRTEIDESAKEAFMQKVIDGYTLTYNEDLYPDKSYSQMKRLSDQVKKQLRQP
ncbi:hypothetical protein [Paenibacillus tuaregi]|uniref:hypothetical protein n=1 Tax=Paenibacillus tuaregi TaxID=1816681 RepID=UPI0008390F1D|nr:hypothetical protein [Paenibacillus tuaregi]